MALKKRKKNKYLKITLIVLAALIILVLIFWAIKFLLFKKFFIEQTDSAKGLVSDTSQIKESHTLNDEGSETMNPSEEGCG